ncbi:hypothetical protein RJT34_13602 [Clitoria ternatea]|uniref:Uncharacterized protein n=1 Tax=Clitoria ternatea TaxID=43366 RepID=A0AAN9PLL5_CLITE
MTGSEFFKDDNFTVYLLNPFFLAWGDHIDTNELIEYWMWEGLLGTVDGISASIQKGKIRDMAITIRRTDPSWHCIVKPGKGLTKPPHIDEWVEDVRRVSLMKNDLKNIFLGNPPPCPGVTSFLLQYNSFPQNIPYNFFDFIKSLKVLDLSYTRIDSLPESVSNLVNLCRVVE